VQKVGAFHLGVVDGVRNNTTQTKPDEDEADPGEEEADLGEEEADSDGEEADLVHSTTARTTGTEEAEEEDHRFSEYQHQVRSLPHQIRPWGTEMKPVTGHRTPNTAHRRRSLTGFGGGVKARKERAGKEGRLIKATDFRGRRSARRGFHFPLEPTQATCAATGSPKSPCHAPPRAVP
jgi:hypothetical protein